MVQYQKALRIYRECEHRSNTALSCTNIGVLLHAKGKYDDALVFFRHALAVNKLALDDDNPESANIHEHIGNALCAKGMYDDVLVAHRKALEKRSSCWEQTTPILRKAITTLEMCCFPKVTTTIP